jgi:HD superfamily phosphodiesterase
MSLSKYELAISEKVQKIYSKEDFNIHIKTTVAHAKNLQKRFGGDRKIIIVAAYLHDIGRYFGAVSNHEQQAIGKVKKILINEGFSKKEIKKVIFVIKNHGLHKKCKITHNLKILSTADALSHFDDFFFMYYDFVRQYSLKRAIYLLINKLARDFNKKIQIKEIKKEYEPVYYQLNNSLLRLLR